MKSLKIYWPLIVYLISITVTGLIWGARLDEKVEDLLRAVTRNEARIVRIEGFLLTNRAGGSELFHPPKRKVVKDSAL